MPMIGDIKRGEEIGYKGTYLYTYLACIDCGRERWVRLHRGEPVYFRCCSCARKGNRNAWKDGRVKHSDGYILIWTDKNSPFTSMKDSRGYIFEHRLVIAKFLGRCLKSWECVHHKNHIRDDNRIENLKLHKTSDHQAITILEEENKKLKAEIKKLRKEFK